MFPEMWLSCSPLSITSAAAFDFLEKIDIQCHWRLVEEMRIMDIEVKSRQYISRLCANRRNGENHSRSGKKDC